jgi:hypothetical protein
MRSIPHRPFQPRPKASEWRWLEYSEPAPEIGKPASRLYVAIEKSVPIDQAPVPHSLRSPTVGSSRFVGADTTSTGSANQTYA